MSLIQRFIDTLIPPTRLTTQQLMELTGKSESFCREAGVYGMYNPLPPVFQGIINPTSYDNYRRSTRIAFGEEFDFPAFDTFAKLQSYFECTQQQLARCFCLQRSLMDRWDRTKGAHGEVFTALSVALGPTYVLSLAMQEASAPQAPDLGKQYQTPSEPVKYTPSDLDKRPPGLVQIPGPYPALIHSQAVSEPVRGAQVFVFPTFVQPATKESCGGAT